MKLHIGKTILLYIRGLLTQESSSCKESTCFFENYCADTFSIYEGRIIISWIAICWSQYFLLFLICHWYINFNFIRTFLMVIFYLLQVPRTCCMDWRSFEAETYNEGNFNSHICSNGASSTLDNSTFPFFVGNIPVACYCKSVYTY